MLTNHQVLTFGNLYSISVIFVILYNKQIRVNVLENYPDLKMFQEMTMILYVFDVT